MPKIIELTVEIEIQKVSCPGVWLCQDGRVSLTVFALGTTYQTCLLPPVFPLMFKDVFYFRKRFQETCALNNICCLLKEETIYCELVQWSDDCVTGDCTVLAQYLGALNDVLFPPNMCSNDGVDLLMRRSKEFPGILSPKIEIATKVRIDELWNQSGVDHTKLSSCHCTPHDSDTARQKAVCHSANYHRHKCNSGPHKRPTSRSRSRSRSGGSRSCCSMTPVEPEMNVSCRCPSPTSKSRGSVRSHSPRVVRQSRRPQYSVYNVETTHGVAWQQEHDDAERLLERNENSSLTRLQKLELESRYIENDVAEMKHREKMHKMSIGKLTPCVCEICRRYHELFHPDG